jgi:putative ABC transport system permease protein
MGRYIGKDEQLQILRPTEVIDGLLQTIFRIKNVLDAVVTVVGLATLMAIVLVFALSLRLRQREIQTVFKIGGSRLTIARLLSAEVLIIALGSSLLCAMGIAAVRLAADDLVRMLFIR